MPGPFAEDFKAIYNVLKVRDFIAIENDNDTVNRQRFNWEFDKANFSYRPSNIFVRDLDTEDCDSFIIWLDYTSPSNIGKQMEEASEVLSKLQSGDIFRITLNANPGTLDDPGEDRMLPEKAKDRRAKLLSRLGVDIDLDHDPTMYGAKKFHETITQCFKYFANESFQGSTLEFFPFLITTYQDGPHKMVTIAGVIFNEDEWRKFLEESNIERLPYTTCDWQLRAISIETPSLSDKERLFIDARAELDWSSERIVKDLGFKVTDGGETKQVESIQRYLDFRTHLPYITRTAPGF